jgi:hypothetical protein
MCIHRLIDFCSEKETNNQKQELKNAYGVPRAESATRPK